ncbi:hypothetical protein D046_7747 [Vibrio parahaemolyticus V-223/04]|nr:hypothetical protein D036_4670 [Vibrio parahaemolyticus VP232]EQM40932.1 hypothetical protein D042_0216 [Vibrio parahaemolyticus NIHCB0757]EVU10975.1 hypothetical protein D046_7747 [Vibrio parahaemolyticus V-223/04]
MGTGAPTSAALARTVVADSISNSEAATVRNFINVLFKVSEKPKISQGSPLLDKLIGNQQLSFRQFLPLP